MKNYILAHDLGTTGNKASLYDRAGCKTGAVFHAYPTEYAHAGWAEQNPEDWWQAVCVSSRQLLQETRIQPGEIACVVFSGQMMGCVPLGRDARPLRNAIIWADQRAVEQERWLGERIPPETVYRITGHRLSASYSLCKMLWLRDHHPELYRATYQFVHAKDAVIARLTGRFVTDPSDASGTNLYDLEGGAYSDRILEAAEVNPGQLPDINLSTAVVGEVLPAVAEETGLATGTPVVVGGGDGSCAAVGAGVIRAGRAYNYIGASSWISLATEAPVYDPDYQTFTWAHLVPGIFTPCGTMQTAGGAYQWARDQLGAPEVQAAQALGVSAYDLMNIQAQKSPLGANGLIFLPYLLGERSPRWNPLARGAFIGLTVRHTRADLLRAVLEGITFNLRIILAALTAQGASIEAVRVIGGGARGRFWNQLLADIYGLPIHRLAVLEEATSMGAAIAGGVGVGLYPDFTVSEHMNQVADVVDPDPANAARYRQRFPLFEAAYQALVPVYERLAEVG